ncbi:SKP1-like protein 1A [Lotus japonicus]|uniref:SKP1-like protein 1A n=1 Tax=Lotus japonicus TaxID=34305 RepID=UPI0025905801|nr:SKP1-like protein 1A [Lotus japonicus]
MCYGGEVMEVHEALVNASPTLKSLIREKGVDGDNKINLPNISIETMCKINEYVKKHAEAVDPAKNLDAWDEEFIKVDLNTLFNLIEATHYLKIQNLIDLGCKTVANMMRGKTTEQMRQTFNIKNDFTPEEEEKVKEKFAWAFE